MSTDTQLLVGGERTTGENVRSQNGKQEREINVYCSMKRDIINIKGQGF